MADPKHLRHFPEVGSTSTPCIPAEPIISLKYILKIISGELKIFAGPINDNQGNEKIKAGEAGGIELLDTTDWLIEGVVGQTK